MFNQKETKNANSKSVKQILICQRDLENDKQNHKLVSVNRSCVPNNNGICVLWIA